MTRFITLRAWAALGLLPGAALAVQPAEPAYREGELLVKYRDVGAAVALKSGLGLHAKRSLAAGRVELVELPRLTTVQQAMELLRQDPRVEYAEPNFRRYKAEAVPNDPLFPQQWGLRNTGQANFVPGGPAGTPAADLNMLQAWDADGDGTADRTGSPSVVVAVIDDAVETAHEDLAANMVAGFDFRDDDNDPNPESGEDFHGTAVAGCLAAVGNNGIGVAGTAWNVKIMPLRFDFDAASHVQALEFARANGARIVNASFGGPGFSQTELDAIRGLGDDDVLYVTAAGNDDSNTDRGQLNYPANYDADNIVAVASISRQDQISSFSQYGSLTVDVAAPGLQIVTTAIGNGYETAEGFGVSGTSFAAPYVAGIAALIRSQLPGATYREIKARLIESGEAGDNAKERTVGGRVDADRALELSPRPSLVVRSVQIDPSGNGRLDAGETASVNVTVQNLWQLATGVTVEATAQDGISFSGGPVVLGTLASGASATASLTVTVPAGISGHQYARLDFQLSALGYSTTRSYLDEIGELTLGVVTQNSFEGPDSDLYDEFHAWHIDVPTLPAGTQALVFKSSADADIDLLVKRGQPPQYNITVGIDPEVDEGGYFCTSGTAALCQDPNTFVGGELDGNESVRINNPEPGTYHVVVVNFAQLDHELPYTLQVVAEQANDGGDGDDGGDGGDDGGSDGGGALHWHLLVLAGLGAGLRRRRDGASQPPTRVSTSSRRWPAWRCSQTY